MNHCRGTAFDKTFSGSQSVQWSVKKDGVPIDCTTTQIGGKVRVQISGGVLTTGNTFIIYDNNGHEVAVYNLVDC